MISVIFLGNFIKYFCGHDLYLPRKLQKKYIVNSKSVMQIDLDLLFSWGAVDNGLHPKF
jgi:hypothetical protein